MAARGFGSRVVLVAPFLSTHAISVELYPFLAPALYFLPSPQRVGSDVQSQGEDVEGGHRVKLATR